MGRRAYTGHDINAISAHAEEYGKVTTYFFLTLIGAPCLGVTSVAGVTTTGTQLALIWLPFNNGTRTEWRATAKVGSPKPNQVVV